MPLTAEEKRVRKLLVNVAKGKTVSRRQGRISYKEIWEQIRPNDKWGQCRVKTVVEWITKIAAMEIQDSRPPLNVIVTRTNKLIPTEPWGTSKNGIKAWLEKKSGQTIPYKSHEEAQEACWNYWSNHTDKGSSCSEIFNTDTSVEEGLREDKQVTFIKRNRKIIEKAKKRDKFTCQSCGFFLEIEKRPIIDCHHKVPLMFSNGLRVTKVSDLVCLCPTCHRIAHTKPFPLPVEKIRKFLVHTNVSGVNNVCK